MDLRRLEYFVAVLDTGTFTGAARECRVSQPALSLGISQLERELGVALFTRAGRGVQLTPAGHALEGPARQALRDVATGQAAVAAVAGVVAGSLTVCSLPTLAADPLAPLIGRFHRAHPGVRVDVLAAEDTEELRSSVRTGLAELGLGTADDVPADLVGRPLGTQRMVAALPPRTRPPADPLPLRHLAGMALVTTPPGTSTRRLLDEGLAPYGLEPSLAVVTALREAVLPLVVAGAGAALIPAPQGPAARRQGAVVVDTDPPVTRSLALLSRPGALAPAAEAFAALALGAVSP